MWKKTNSNENFDVPMGSFRVGVRMTQGQNDTVRHFGTEGHFNTATK